MAPDTSQFESSEMLATFLASTPLLEESWSLCRRANHRSYAVHVAEEVAYVAFSGVQVAGSCRSLVELGDGFFSSFRGRVDGNNEAVMVDAHLLHLFQSFFDAHNFHQKMVEILNQNKSVVFAGHSIGGAIASLSTLWLLSYINQTAMSSKSVLCITYGSPMLGNESFSQAILHERWGGNFCHVVAQNDLLPRLIFAPSSRLISHWPFGSYVFCTEKGAVCLDNAPAVVKFLYLTMAENKGIEDDHLRYDDCVGKLCWQYLQKTSFMEVSVHESNNQAGIALALQSSGISTQEPTYSTAITCLATARQIGWRRNLNNAKMAVSLAKINPCRAELEWYKSYCENSQDELGYYDSFKTRGASKRGFKVNMNRLRLGRFWDDLIDKLLKNHLTHDFHKLLKYVNASHFYKLLVEPLEIAEYYRRGLHVEKGHYIEHGRERRFKIFDKWWEDRNVGDEEGKPRSKYASFTQDSCFWARVEEARELVRSVASETDRSVSLEKIEGFEEYAIGMVERKEVSIDVFARNSSYSLFGQEWKELKSKMKLLPSSHFED